MAEAPLVSCLCVTRNRVRLLRRAVACFLEQTYQPRELLVVHEADDLETCDYLRTLEEPSIRGVKVAAAAPLPLGMLRNFSLRSARGSHVAQWDDDDWHAPARLADQMRTIAEAGRPGCVLARWTIFDMETGTAFISGKRLWEGSLVAERSAVPLYPAQSRGEDSTVIESMMADNKLAALDNPYLYIYIYHGGNVWHRAHWEALMRAAQPLSPEMSAQVAQVVGADPGGRQGPACGSSS